MIFQEISIMHLPERSFVCEISTPHCSSKSSSWASYFPLKISKDIFPAPSFLWISNYLLSSSIGWAWKFPGTICSFKMIWKVWKAFICFIFFVTFCYSLSMRLKHVGLYFCFFIVFQCRRVILLFIVLLGW